MWSAQAIELMAWWIMSIEQRAAELVAAADPAEVAAVIASFPKGEDIAIRDNWQAINPHFGARVPKAPAARMAYLTERVEQHKKSHLVAIGRYDSLRELGLAALSPYDVCISSGDNPVSALRCALRLTNAHVSYDLTILIQLSDELESLRCEVVAAEPPQLALF